MVFSLTAAYKSMREDELAVELDVAASDSPARRSLHIGDV